MTFCWILFCSTMLMAPTNFNYSHQWSVNLYNIISISAARLIWLCHANKAMVNELNESDWRQREWEGKLGWQRVTACVNKCVCDSVCDGVCESEKAKSVEGSGAEYEHECNNQWKHLSSQGNYSSSYLRIENQFAWEFSQWRN